MVKLIARLEAATGPDRDLDALIWEIVNPAEYERRCSFKGMKHGGHVFTKAEKRAHVKHIGGLFAAAYTASIDAAMTMVPEEWQRGVLSWPGYDNGKLTAAARADLYHVFSSGGPPTEQGYAATLPLALCIAALKARASTTLRGGEIS